MKDYLFLGSAIIIISNVILTLTLFGLAKEYIKLQFTVQSVLMLFAKAKERFPIEIGSIEREVIEQAKKGINERK